MISDGRTEAHYRHSVAEKPGLDANKLTFVSKLVERVVALRLVGYLNSHGLMPQLQSAYRHHHSTLLNVLSDIYAAV